jgi:hypothetical protein
MPSTATRIMESFPISYWCRSSRLFGNRDRISLPCHNEIGSGC